MTNYRNIVIAVLALSSLQKISCAAISQADQEKAAMQRLKHDVEAALNQASSIINNTQAQIAGFSDVTDQEKARAIVDIDELFNNFLKQIGHGQASAPKTTIQKPMSEARKKARAAVLIMQSGNSEKVIKRNKKRAQLSEEMLATLDKNLFDALTEKKFWGKVYQAIDEGADPNTLVPTDKNILVPAFWGMMSKDRFSNEMLTILMRNGANLDLKASNGMPLLNYLVQYWPGLEATANNPELLIPTIGSLQYYINDLMSHGVDLTSTDADGKTFLDILLQRFNDPFIENSGKQALDSFIKKIDQSNAKELGDLVAEYKKELRRSLREAAEQPIMVGQRIIHKGTVSTQAQQEARQREVLQIPEQQGIRRIIGEYLAGQEESPEPKKE